MVSSSGNQSLGAKVGTALLEQVGQRLWGFKPNLMVDIVDQNGAGTSVAWFAKNMPGYEKILKQWGPIRTHLVATVTSAMTGCPYCTYGHAYALELHVFKEHDRLLGADEREIESWCSLEDDAVVDNFRTMLIAAELNEELPVLDRLVELRNGAVANDSVDDKHLSHLLSMFEFLNQCGISARTDSDQAHDPINKEDDLRARYHQRRASV